MSAHGEKIRAVLFDLDGTLLDRASTFELFLNRQYDRFRVPLSGIERSRYLRRVIDLDKHGHVPKAEVYAEVQKEFGLTSEWGQALLADFEAHFHGLAIPFPGLYEMLDALSSLALAMGIVSNGTSRAQRPKIEALKISGHFGAILISEEEGVRKPDPEIFYRAMRALNSTPGTTVFVGDHPEADIAGAARVGLRTIWKRNDCWAAPQRADAVIDRLDEIPPLIARWSNFHHLRRRH